MSTSDSSQESTPSRGVDPRIIAALVAAAATIMVAVIALIPHCKTSSPIPIAKKLTITNFNLIDESKSSESDSTSITHLSIRKNTEFDIISNKDLVVPFVFLVKNYHIDEAGDMHLKARVEYKRMDSGAIVIAPLHTLTNIDDWQKRPTITDLGIDTVRNHFGLQSSSSGDPIPYAVVLHDFEENIVANGKAEITVIVEDYSVTPPAAARFTQSISIRM